MYFPVARFLPLWPHLVPQGGPFWRFLSAGALLPSTLTYLSRAGDIRVPACSRRARGLLTRLWGAFGAPQFSGGEAGGRMGGRAALRAAMERLRRPMAPSAPRKPAGPPNLF